MTSRRELYWTGLSCDTAPAGRPSFRDMQEALWDVQNEIASAYQEGRSSLAEWIDFQLSSTLLRSRPDFPQWPVSSAHRPMGRLPARRQEKVHFRTTHPT